MGFGLMAVGGKVITATGGHVTMHCYYWLTTRPASSDCPCRHP
jgi:hypothetical protein